MRIQRTGREVFHDHEAVVAIAADGKDLRYANGFASRQQLQLIGLGGEDRQEFPFVAFHEVIFAAEAQMPGGMDLSAGQLGFQFDFSVFGMPIA